jgi:MSHA biogenesis protein MshJ
MTTNIETFQQRFAMLSQREKLMVVGAVLLILWAGWDNLFYQALQKNNRAVEAEIASLQSQLHAHEQIAKQLQDISRNDPNAGNRQQLAHLQQSVSSLKQQLSLGEKKFVPSQLMANALRDMLKQHGNLKLIKLETLPVSAFGINEQQPAWVYRHAMAITLQGDYFSTLNYLKALENLPWRIHWDSIAYQVKDYPMAETRIQVYTLSFEEDWLGV